MKFFAFIVLALALFAAFAQVRKGVWEAFNFFSFFFWTRGMYADARGHWQAVTASQWLSTFTSLFAPCSFPSSIRALFPRRVFCSSPCPVALLPPLGAFLFFNPERKSLLSPTRPKINKQKNRTSLPERAARRPPPPARPRPPTSLPRSRSTRPSPRSPPRSTPLVSLDYLFHSSAFFFRSTLAVLFPSERHLPLTCYLLSLPLFHLSHLSQKHATDSLRGWRGRCRLRQGRQGFQALQLKELLLFLFWKNKTRSFNKT